MLEIKVVANQSLCAIKLFCVIKVVPFSLGVNERVYLYIYDFSCQNWGQFY